MSLSCPKLSNSNMNWPVHPLTSSGPPHTLSPALMSSLLIPKHFKHVPPQCLSACCFLNQGCLCIEAAPWPRLYL